MSDSDILPQVQAMLDKPGLYIGRDTGWPHIFIPLISENGKVFSVVAKTMQKDCELDPTRFYDTLTLRGPVSYEDWLIG